MVITTGFSQSWLLKTQENRTLNEISGRLNVGTEEKEDTKEGFRAAFSKKPCAVRMLVGITCTHKKGCLHVSLYFIRIFWPLNTNVTVTLQESDGM